MGEAFDSLLVCGVGVLWCDCEAVLLMMMFTITTI